MFDKLQYSVNRLTFFSVFIWVLAALFFLYDFFIRAALNNLVQEVLLSLKVSIEQLSLIDIAYCITYGLMQIPVGILADRYGVRRVLIVAIGVCSLGIFLFSLAHGFYLAFFSRLLIGFGSAFAFICLLVLTLNWLPKKLHGTFFGFAQLVGAIGPMLAGLPMVLMLKATHDNWRLILVLVGIIGFLLLLLVLFFMQNKPAHVLQEKKYLVAKPQLLSEIFSLLKNKQVWWIILYSASVYTSLALLGTLWGTSYLEARGFLQTKAAFIASVLWLGLALGAPLLGAISDFFKQRKPLLIFCALCGLLVSLTIIYTPINNQWLFIGLFFALGIASAGQSIAFITLAEKASPNTRATALGLNNAGISFAIALVIPMVGFIIQHSLAWQTNVPSRILFQQNNFTHALLIMPGLYFLALVLVVLRIKE